MYTTFIFIAGLAMLLVGGQLLVSGSKEIAIRMGMSPLLIGLTLVAFGTSAPELVTSVQASLVGSPGIAIGNVVGSNIVNLLFILGITAFIRPLPVSDRVLKIDSLIMLAVAILFLIVSCYFSLSRTVGAVFVVLLAAYIFMGWITGTHEAAPQTKEVVRVRDGMRLHVIFVVVGLLMLSLGGKLLVDAATSMARAFAISEVVIGVTIVAIGTSLPELITSVVAAIKGEDDIALGNVVGSNIYNILGIAGITGLIAPTEIPSAIITDNLVMVGATLLAIIFFWSNRNLMRYEGAIMLCVFAIYTYTLF